MGDRAHGPAPDSRQYVLPVAKITAYSKAMRSRYTSPKSSEPIEFCNDCTSEAHENEHVKLCKSCHKAIAPVIKKVRRRGEDYSATVGILAGLLGSAVGSVIAANIVNSPWSFSGINY